MQKLIYWDYPHKRLEFVLDFAFSIVLDKQPLAVTKSWGKKHQSVLFVWCNTYFAKALFPFLFNRRFLLPKWNPLMPLLSIKLILFFIQKFFRRAFVSVRVFWIFVLSLRLMIDENEIDVYGNSLETLLMIFYRWSKGLHYWRHP